jgi:hypothetical protein
MSEELISEVQVLESGKLLLRLQSGGRPDYSNIYREGVGVYWEPNLKGFISTDVKEWSYAKWFNHIVNTAAGCGINMRLSKNTNWLGFPDKDKEEVEKSNAI